MWESVDPTRYHHQHQTVTLVIKSPQRAEEWTAWYAARRASRFLYPSKSGPIQGSQALFGYQPQSVAPQKGPLNIKTEQWLTGLCGTTHWLNRQNRLQYSPLLLARHPKSNRGPTETEEYCVHGTTTVYSFMSRDQQCSHHKSLTLCKMPRATERKHTEDLISAFVY